MDNKLLNSLLISLSALALVKYCERKSRLSERRARTEGWLEGFRDGIWFVFFKGWLKGQQNNEKKHE